jgi:cytoskeletal protein RodZ
MVERPRSAAGAELRAAREAKGLSRQHVAEITKISSRTLEAVERGDYSRLPGGIFMRSFVRAYAVEVGLDPEAIVKAFLAECPAEVGAIPTAAPASIDGPRPPRSFEGLPWGRFAAAAALVMIIVGSAYAYLSRPLRDEGRHPARAPASQAAARGEVPVATSGSSLTLGVKAVAPCWLSMAVDGQTSKMRLLARDESFVVRSEREVTLKVGDGAALSLTINGRPARPLGGPGDPAAVSITPTNYGDYLAER